MLTRLPSTLGFSLLLFNPQLLIPCSFLDSEGVPRGAARRRVNASAPGSAAAADLPAGASGLPQDALVAHKVDVLRAGRVPGAQRRRPQLALLPVPRLHGGATPRNGRCHPR